MKKIMCCITVCLFLSCGNGSASYHTETSQNVENVTCPKCYGHGCNLCGYDGVVYIPVTVENVYEKKRSNVSFKSSKKKYYAECSHCKCDLYVPISSGDSYCANCANNGHYKSLRGAHFERYR